MKPASSTIKKVQDLLDDGNPAINERITADTERFRKGFAKLIIRKDGKEISNAEIEYELTRHEFLFGCNGFMFGEFTKDSQNQNYADKFKELFNLAVVPFYWDAYEPEDGYSRDSKTSRKLYRRPPAELLVDYCERNSLYAKGHCLAYQGFEPKWLPKDPHAYLNRLERRFREIGERFGSRIQIWDIVNERYCASKSVDHHPWDYIEHALTLGAKHLPQGAIKVVNEATNACWTHHSREFTPFPMLLDNLRAKGYTFDQAGLQFHMFKKGVEEYFYESYARLLRRDNLLAYLDGFKDYNIPMHVSEITLPGADVNGGEELQAEIAAHLYRTWFSHPLMRGIVWWNLVDNTGFGAPIGTDGGENKTKAGMLNYDFSEKKIFTVLKKLIKEEWTTKGTLSYQKMDDLFAVTASSNKFHGYYGDYRIKITLPDGSIHHRSIKLSRDCGSTFKLELD